MSKDYVKHHQSLVNLMGELGAKIPATMKGFGELHHAGIQEGVLPSKTKE